MDAKSEMVWLYSLLLEQVLVNGQDIVAKHVELQMVDGSRHELCVVVARGRIADVKRILNTRDMQLRNINDPPSDNNSNGGNGGAGGAVM